MENSRSSCLWKEHENNDHITLLREVKSRPAFVGCGFVSSINLIFKTLKLELEHQSPYINVLLALLLYTGTDAQGIIRRILRLCDEEGRTVDTC